MSTTPHANPRKTLATIMLGCWLFAFFAGVVHACGLAEHPAPPSPSNSAASCLHGHGNEHSVPGCKQFRANDSPLLAQPQSLQDPPGSPLFFPATLFEARWARALSAPRLPLHPHPPRGVAHRTRLVRLAL